VVIGVSDGMTDAVPDHAECEAPQNHFESGPSSRSAKDIISFLAAINRHHFQSDNVILCLCNSGRRSLHAVEILRSINYDRCFSVAGGVRAWREKCPRAERDQESANTQL
jgi:rhodanese-related sulfurtransferase